ncbi:MAG: ABC transporter ATP-binding protein [Verrucomicrobia bacterium]|nr:ABC transporter ATP-binding protein [Verrucomicrobiota bacterium]
MKNADSEKGNKISAIEIENLTKDFRVGMRGVKLRAVDNVSFFVNPGEIFGLLGPNGSGKSTTLKIILGLLRPTSGECRIFGKKSSDISVRSRIGFLPEAPYFYGYLTGRELVKYYARMSGVPAQKIEEATEDALALTGMTAAAARRVKTYSKGMLQRIGVAQAVVHNPDLVILDEPTAGIDPIGSAEIGDAIRTMKSRGKTVVLCSHLLGQIEELCDRVAIMNRGKLSVAGTLDEVLTQRDKQLAVIGNGTPLTPELCAELRERYGIRIERVSQPRISLEKYFLENLKK